VISSLILVVWHNRAIKFIMWDSCKEQFGPLSIRVACGNASLFINFMAVYYFQLTVCAMVINSAPMLTFFAAQFFFGEKVTLWQVLSLFCAFGGLMLMLWAGDKQ
jgi:drug/metabolite transporter (DMT)-like permease